ncbi:hypothetical protein [uncultured Ruminococcus sp.]|jgi:predicted DNA-binding protein|uniref:hypothetical protein n=1 Tax=Ruminococcus sp. TaxID=41978 RepID=UPI0015B4F550|nr:hypothetical protein [uncultured Ruminococcus sp.]
MKKTVAITEECNNLLKELAKNNDTTESKIVKWAIEEYADRDKQEHPDEVVEIKRRIAKIQEQNFHLLNLLNSFIEKMQFNDSEGYFSADDLPCHWLEESKNEYHQKQLKNRLDTINKR